jgi:hypothetical protein
MNLFMLVFWLYCLFYCAVFIHILYEITIVLQDFPEKYTPPRKKRMGTYCDICGEKDVYEESNPYSHAYCQNEDCSHELSFCLRCRDDAEYEYPACPQCQHELIYDF